jgi:hypothetical protein
MLRQAGFKHRLAGQLRPLETQLAQVGTALVIPYILSMRMSATRAMDVRRKAYMLVCTSVRQLCIIPCALTDSASLGNTMLADTP